MKLMSLMNWQGIDVVSEQRYWEGPPVAAGFDGTSIRGGENTDDSSSNARVQMPVSDEWHHLVGSAFTERAAESEKGFLSGMGRQVFGPIGSFDRVVEAAQDLRKRPPRTTNREARSVYHEAAKPETRRPVKRRPAPKAVIFTEDSCRHRSLVRGYRRHYPSAKLLCWRQTFVRSLAPPSLSPRNPYIATFSGLRS